MADHGLLWSDVLTDVPGLLMIQHIAMFPVFLRWTSTAATGGAYAPEAEPARWKLPAHLRWTPLRADRAAFCALRYAATRAKSVPP